MSKATEQAREIERLQHDLDQAERRESRVTENLRRAGKGLDRQAYKLKVAERMYEAADDLLQAIVKEGDRPFTQLERDLDNALDKWDKLP